MIKKILLSLLSVVFFISCGVKKDNTIKIATSVYPMEEIVKIASKNLEKKRIQSRNTSFNRLCYS